MGQRRWYRSRRRRVCFESDFSFEIAKVERAVGFSDIDLAGLTTPFSSEAAMARTLAS